MDYIFDNLHIAKERLVTNSIKSFEGMTAQRWIRIIVIVGAYMLVRPYLLKAAANRQKKQLEQDADELGLGEPGVNANSLRGGGKSGGGKVLGEVKDEPKADWGNKAKTRQRKAVEKKLNAREEAEEEREIRQFLQD